MSNYRCMCRDNHEPIGYTRDDESCPLCDALTRAEAAEQRAKELEKALRLCIPHMEMGAHNESTFASDDRKERLRIVRNVLK